MSDHAERVEVEITPGVTLRLADVRELWHYRELAWVLARRDVSVRYKQTAFGAIWVVLQPLALMAVFSIFLGRLARVPHDGSSYALSVLTALTVWTYTASATDGVANSVVSSAQVVSKVYFPRLVLPLASAAAFIVDMMINALLVVVAVVLFGDGLPLSALAAPVFLAITVLAVLGVGVWLAALNVRYRDVKFIVRLGLQLWLFLSPVAYPASIVPDRWQWLYELNPLVGPINGLRWAVLGVGGFPTGAVVSSIAVSGALFVLGIRYFRMTEHQFADIV